MIKNPISRLYTGKMTVIRYEKTVNDYGETIFSEEILHQDIACGLSVLRSAMAKGMTVAKNGLALEEARYFRIFCDSDFWIPSGCKIRVRQDGVEQEFAYSGGAAVYPTHQELTVKQIRFV